MILEDPVLKLMSRNVMEPAESLPTFWLVNLLSIGSPIGII